MNEFDLLPDAAPKRRVSFADSYVSGSLSSLDGTDKPKINASELFGLNIRTSVWHNAGMDDTNVENYK